TVLEGNGSLPKIEVNTDHSTAEIYLHGAHVTDFQKKGDPPLLFTSQFSRFAHAHPIRGGLPIIFPWFGAREGEPMHGFARTSPWELHEAISLPEGGVTLRFHLPEMAESGVWPPFTANYIVTVSDKLVLELLITNSSPDQNFTFETCFHSYFFVGDIGEVSISGLKGVSYLDKVDHFSRKTEGTEPIRISSEVDRIYLDTPHLVEIEDRKLRRTIRIEK